MTVESTQDLSLILGTGAFRLESVERYQAWINDFQLGESPPLFKNQWLNVFTKTPYWLPPLVWLPVAALSLSTCEGMSTGCIVFAVASGLFLWTFLEYIFHRFCFHFFDRFELLPAWALALHFLIHGIHHRYPRDPFRLVFPPVLAQFPIMALYFFLRLLAPLTWTHAIFSGVLSAYVIYEETHFFYHHCPKKLPSWCLRQQKIHMLHHSKCEDSLHFGVTSQFWDHAFDTAGR